MARINSKKRIIDYENSIKKSNELSMAKLSHGFTLNQMQLLAYSIYCTQQNGKTEFHKSDFERKFSMEKYNTVRVKEDIDFLDTAMVSLVNIVNLEEEFIKKKTIKLFREIEYNKGLFTFKWDEELLPHIIDLKEKYVLTDLTTTSKFKSGFSWILYDFLRALYGYWHKPLSKDFLMRLFGVDDKKTYQTNTGKFKQTVLDVAIAEINEHTELEVHYKEEKKGRTIIGFDLIWSNGRTVPSATQKQIKELQTILDIVFEDVFGFVNLKNDASRERAIEIVRIMELMKIYTEPPICITKETADNLIQQANWNFRELNHFLEEDGKKKLPFYNWLEA